MQSRGRVLLVFQAGAQPLGLGEGKRMCEKAEGGGNGLKYRRPGACAHAPAESRLQPIGPCGKLAVRTGGVVRVRGPAAGSVRHEAGRGARADGRGAGHAQRPAPPH